MSKILLKDALLVTHDRIIRNDLLIEGNIIAKIGNNLSDSEAKVLDCHEQIVFPGLIDEHVHFREPGMTQKATIYSESRAAVLGGVTSFLDMPNNNPSTTTMDLVNAKKDIARRDSVANFGFYLGATDDNLEEIKKAPVNEIAGIKVFMGSSTGNLLVDDYEKLTKIFENARTIIALHCEDTKTILANEKIAKNTYGDNVPFSMHGIIRSRDCCIKSTALAIQIAKETGARIHLMHLSTYQEVAMLKDLMYGNVKTRQISGEACIPHLYFSESFYAQKGPFLKCNPAVKTEKDRLALVQALESGVITTVGTDHAPHELSAKGNQYFKCASGLPSVQFSLLALLDLWKRKEITLETIAKVTSTIVAERFRIKNRGRIAEGYAADLAIVNPTQRTLVTKDLIASSCKWSPFENHSFSSAVVHTIVNGNLVVENGKLVSEEKGQALEFDRE